MDSLLPSEIHRLTIEELIVLPLILDVLLDDVFIDSNCADEVASTPETFLLNSMALFGEQIVHTDCTLTFEKSHDVGNGVFWRNTEKHVNVIWASIGFDDFYFFLRCEEANDLSYLSPCMTIQNFLTIFWYNDDVILAVPDHMTLRFE